MQRTALRAEAFDSTIDAISEHPELGATVEGDVRRYLLRGFPYSVFDLASDKEVIVVGCLHGARDPESWPSGGAV